MDKDIEHAEDYIQRLEDENASLREAQERLMKWAVEERADWSERNADRYWQMERVIRAIKDAALTSPARTEGQT